jgi:hypothetical protein
MRNNKNEYIKETFSITKNITMFCRVTEKPKKRRKKNISDRGEAEVNNVFSRVAI